MGIDKLPTAKAKELLEDDGALATWLENTQSFGLSLVTGLDARHDAGMEVAKRIGFLRETNFGSTFQVQSKPNPNNLAYTAVALPPHTDLPNQELPLGFSFYTVLRMKQKAAGQPLQTAWQYQQICVRTISRLLICYPLYQFHLDFMTKIRILEAENM